MIIVEGPDGAGKTTLVSRIEHDWDLTREPRVVSSEAHALAPLGEWIEKQIDAGFSTKLYDRFGLISSPCYTMLEGRTMVEPLTNPTWLKGEIHRLRRIDPVIIWCLPPLETVIDNVFKEDNSGGRVSYHLEEIYLAYVTSYAHWSQGPASTSQMIWDYTKPDLPHLANLIRWAHARVEREKNGR